ncbi:MAG TPA: S8 family serine peptidase [Phycisphaerales bacterium]
MTRRTLWTLVVLAGTTQVGAAASLPEAGPIYIERPGTTEFTGRMIVRPRPYESGDFAIPGATLARSAAARLRLNQNGMSVVRYWPETDEYLVEVAPPGAVALMLPGARGHDENARSRELLQTGDYQYAQPDWKCYPTATPNDTLYSSQWHLPQIKAPQAWDITTGASSFIVAIVDSGIDKTHPDLASRLVPGYVSVEGKTEAQGGDVSDVNGHGTNCAGTAAAIGNNALGVSGAGWNFKIMPVRCSANADGTASQSAILDGARWAAQNGARTISASFTGVDSAAVGTTGTFIKSRGGLFFYAAGNDNINWSGFYYPDTVVVGATSFGDAKAGFSGYGNGVAVFAPGVSILTTFVGGGYGYNSGTSFATPLTNGVAALAWSVNPGLTPDQLQQILYSSTDRLGNTSLVYPARDSVFGFGRINAYKAVLAAQGSVGAPVAVPDNTGGFLPSPRNIDVLANDSDPSTLGLTITSFSSTTTLGGTITRLVGAGPNGRDVLRYTPPAVIPPHQPDPPVDTFSYSIKNSVNKTSTTTSSIVLYQPANLRSAQSPASIANGLIGAYFDLAALTPVLEVPNFGEATLVASKVDSVIAAGTGGGGLGGTGLTANAGAVFRGFFNIPGDDIYRFYLTSDDGARVYINNELLVDNDGVHTASEASGFVPLKAGLHRFRVEYFNAADTGTISMRYEAFGALSTAGFAKRTIPATAYKYSTCPADLNLDGAVDDTDFVLFATGYNQLLGFEGDLNYDARVDDADFVLFAAAYDLLTCP